MWWLITTIPKNKEASQNLNIEGKRLGIVPARNMKEAIERFSQFNKCPNRVRIFPCELIE